MNDDDVGADLVLALLWAGPEELRLWECVAEWVPEVKDRTPDHVQRTREALRTLLDRGWLGLYWDQRPGQPALSPDEVDAVLADPMQWDWQGPNDVSMYVLPAGQLEMERLAAERGQ